MTYIQVQFLGEYEELHMHDSVVIDVVEDRINRIRSNKSRKKQYTFISKSDDVQVGHMAVVLANDNKLRFTVVGEVHDVNPKTFEGEPSIALATFDFSAVIESRERAKRAATLRSALKSRLEGMREMDLFHQLAERDAIAQKLLDELKEIEGGTGAKLVTAQDGHPQDSE